MQLKALLCCGVVVALLLIAQVAPTWATASESPLRQTVPTKTPTDEPPPATTEPPPPATTKPPGPPPPGATDTPVSTLPPGVTATSTGLVATPPPVPTISGPAVFMTETVNVRVGPGTEFDVVGQYYRGYWAPATGKNAEPPTWWQVVYEAAPGQRGWVNAQYVVPNAEALKLPVVWGTPTAPAPAVTPATTTASQAPVATTAPAATVAPSKPAATGVPVATAAPANPSASVAMTASATPGPASTTGQGENISVTDLAPPVGVVLVLIGFGLWWSRRGKG